MAEAVTAVKRQQVAFSRARTFGHRLRRNQNFMNA